MDKILVEWPKEERRQPLPGINSKKYFCWVSPPKNGKVKTLSRFHPCREVMANFVKTCHTIPELWKEGPEKIDINNLRVMMLAVDRCVIDENDVLKSVRFLNMIERKLKWSLTKIRKVENPFQDRTYSYIFTGSGRWMTSPHTISLYLLILRSGEALKQHAPKKFTKEEFVRCSSPIAPNMSSYSDLSYLKKAFRHAFILLTNLDKVFKDLSKLDTFKLFGMSSGINSIATSTEFAVLKCKGMKIISYENFEKRLYAKGSVLHWSLFSCRPAPVLNYIKLFMQDYFENLNNGE